MTSGICLLCSSTYTKAGMTRHLQSCIPKSLQNQLGNLRSILEGYLAGVLRSYERI